jgi:hypothetical protein
MSDLSNKGSEADFFTNVKVKHHTLEDGHVGRNMQCRTATTKRKTICNKAADDGNITSNFLLQF